MRHSITLLSAILIFFVPSLMAQIPEQGEKPYFDFATKKLHLPAVEVSPLGTYVVSMKLVKSDPILFELLTVKAVKGSSQAIAHYSLENGVLNIPSIEVDNETYAVELVWERAVSEVMRFRLTYIIPTSELLETPPYPTDAQLRQIHQNQEVTFKGITYPISDEVTESYGKSFYFAKYGRFRGGAYGVYIPQEYDGVNPLPMIMASHGAGIMGPRELQNWNGFAEKYGFIVVTPSYLVATNEVFETQQDVFIHLDEEIRMTEYILTTVVNALKVDTSNILGTGFSGGSYSSYLFMMNYPEYFTALCIRSPNYSDEYQIDFDTEKWKKRPIYIFWGENDLEIVKDEEGPELLNYLQSGLELTSEYNNRTAPNSFISKNGLFKWDILPNSGHDHHADLTSEWFITDVVNAP
ncbi:hypothetical protein PN36_03970 [Candidatus Thiomargarita nelsonii]|uniref:Peptidase S9 prolyl oligopeptidase catalytic domain-containing protein n=1 Tax=Candidatus Thiomargarita nelsonii TaxID=1003181 RepID=A0A4E0QW59_9GAMM|nr:hypothetical protein PN36_03970 [Candidatus Thiomargarita nelsonii]